MTDAWLPTHDRQAVDVFVCGCVCVCVCTLAMQAGFTDAFDKFKTLFTTLEPRLLALKTDTITELQKRLADKDALLQAERRHHNDLLFKERAKWQNEVEILAIMISKLSDRQEVDARKERIEVLERKVAKLKRMLGKAQSDTTPEAESDTAPQGDPTPEMAGANAPQDANA